MDKQKRDALLRRIGPADTWDRVAPLVTLEEFFEGNDDGASIWCNLPSAPKPQKVFAILKGIRDRADVSDVKILVTQYDGGEDEWPFSDTVFIAMSGDAEAVNEWLGEDFAPDEMSVCEKGGWPDGLKVPERHIVVAGWWD
jgi:hypothetical protein